MILKSSVHVSYMNLHEPTHSVSYLEDEPDMDQKRNHISSIQITGEMYILM